MTKDNSLQGQLDKANAARNKADSALIKANADRNKARADWNKANDEVQRIKQLIKEK